MYKFIKWILTCLFIASAPLSAFAGTIMFSGERSSGYMSGTNGGLAFDVGAYQYAARSRSLVTNTPGAFISGSNYVGNSCWHAWGATDSLQFDASNQAPRFVIASGAVALTWRDYCGSQPTFTETVSFNMNVTAISPHMYYDFGTEHENYEYERVMYRWDYAASLANVSADSYISSPRFGTVMSLSGQVQQTKNFQIIRE